ncbi:hypothetical protein V2G26_017504 [Clonostachys chloroleuca]
MKGDNIDYVRYGLAPTSFTDPGGIPNNEPSYIGRYDARGRKQNGRSVDSLMLPLSTTPWQIIIHDPGGSGWHY